jgi:hypothetical protein
MPVLVTRQAMPMPNRRREGQMKVVGRLFFCGSGNKCNYGKGHDEKGKQAQRGFMDYQKIEYHYRIRYRYGDEEDFQQ